MTPIDLVLSRLPGARAAGPNRWSARCPAHDDRTPSLSVSTGDDGRVLLTCHAHCTLGQICAALGFTVNDLFLPRPTGGKFETFKTPESLIARLLEGIRRTKGPCWILAKSYSYTDAAGRELMRVLRFESPDGKQKTCRPIHCANGQWVPKDPPGPLPLYQLPHIGAAPQVYACEGEKAVDTATALGLVATTSSHGANSASKTDWSPLAGREVVVLPDNDEPGRRYAHDVAEILVALKPPARVRILALPNLPERGDIVEFVAARREQGLGDADIRVEIERLVELAEYFVSSGSGSPGTPPESEPVFGEPEPLPNSLPRVDPFDGDLMPRTLRPWIKDIAERIQCPPDFPGVAAMVALAAVVGRKVGIRPKQRDDWLVVPNLWGALVGRPGIMKTPPLQEATRPLKRLEINAKKAFDEQCALHAAQQLVFEERRKVVQKNLRADLEQNDEAAALEKAREAVASDPTLPVRRRYIVNDTTVEKLGEILNQNPNGVLALRDELSGFLKSLEKEGQESARAFYLEAWNGTGRFTYDRIGRGTLDIDAAIVCVLGSIQPGRLGRYLRAAGTGGDEDDGLISRFQLLVWPDISRQWKNVDEWPNSAARNAAYAVFERLDRLTPDSIGASAADELDGIPFLRFTPEAQVVFDRWRAGLERRLRADEEHEALEDHFAKYRSLIPSLALLIHLADGGVGPVPLEPLRMALAWGRYLSSHARRVYSTAVAPEFAAARRLLAHIRKGDLQDQFTEREVYRHQWSGLGQDDVRLGLGVLVEYGWLASQINKKLTGRPSTEYRINPRIRSARSEGTDRTDETGEPRTAGDTESGEGAAERPANTDETGAGDSSGSSGSAEGGHVVGDGAPQHVADEDPGARQGELLQPYQLRDPEASSSVGDP